MAAETDVPSDALFAAIRAADASTVQQLLGARPNLLAARDAQGLSPLMVALYHNASAIADLLLDRLPRDSLTIHEAAATGNVGRLEQLLAQDPQAVNAWSPDGFQPLGLAAFFGRAEASELLLQRGGDINTPARHPFGVTALHAALASPNPEFARALIGAGADVNAAQSGGETPLHEAAFNGYLDLARFLLEHGANPAALDSKGRTPFELARERDQKAVAELLEGR